MCLHLQDTVHYIYPLLPKCLPQLGLQDKPRSLIHIFHMGDKVSSTSIRIYLSLPECAFPGHGKGYGAGAESRHSHTEWLCYCSDLLPLQGVLLTRASSKYLSAFVLDPSDYISNSPCFISPETAFQRECLTVILVEILSTNLRTVQIILFLLNAPS